MVHPHPLEAVIELGSCTFAQTENGFKKTDKHLKYAKIQTYIRIKV